MRLPSIKTLSQVFTDAKHARAILQMSRTELERLPAGAARVRECWYAPKTWDVRLTCLDAIGGGLFGVECAETTAGEYAAYLNAGDTYAPTVIYWRGAYRVQSFGDFVETLERRSIHFK